MKIVKSPKQMQNLSNRWRDRGLTIGFVPTMGFLHEGHLSLADRAKKECDIVVMSIYVNPTQFGANEDLSAYPRDFKRDHALAQSRGVDVIFYPSDKDMYPEGYCTYVTVEGLTQGLCGRSRPVHFRGVATICDKLFNIVKPHRSYFGQKDGQQAAVISKMVQDLNLDMKVVVCPTVREKDGLAMSSRNKYLEPEQRKQAAALFRSLNLAKALIKKGETSPGRIIKAIEKEITSESIPKIDYVEIVDSRTMRPVKKIQGEVMIALAVLMGRTRLIDNMVVKPASVGKPIK